MFLVGSEEVLNWRKEKKKTKKEVKTKAKGMQKTTLSQGFFNIEEGK